MRKIKKKERGSQSKRSDHSHLEGSIDFALEPKSWTPYTFFYVLYSVDGDKFVRSSSDLGQFLVRTEVILNPLYNARYRARKKVSSIFFCHSSSIEAWDVGLDDAVNQTYNGRNIPVSLCSAI